MFRLIDSLKLMVICRIRILDVPPMVNHHFIFSGQAAYNIGNPRILDELEIMSQATMKIILGPNKQNFDALILM